MYIVFETEFCNFSRTLLLQKSNFIFQFETQILLLKVGVDCMRLDKERNNKTADEYINSMARSASSEELLMMRSQPTEAMKMAYFYRYWCLKEAILKVLFKKT